MAPPPDVATAPPKRRRGFGRRMLLLSLLIAFCALATIGIVTFVGWQIGPLALTVGIIGAVLPVPLLVAAFLWLDRYDPSPLWIVVSSFLWGAGVATSGALVVNQLAADALEARGYSIDIVAVVVAPVIEELLKALYPLLLFAFYRRAFTGIIDGIVYCGLSATGFAMVENILYLGGHGFASESEKGYAAGAFAVTAIFILRVPLTGFAHPLFTSMTGLGIGIAARSPRRAVRFFAPLLGLLAAMVLHAAWNGMATLAQADPYFILYGYFALFMPIFFGMLGFALWVRSWEGRLAERVLPVYVRAGWFSPPEIVALGTLGRRLSARTWARRVAGEAGHTAMRNYQFAATRLALLRDALNRGFHRSPEDQANARHEERLLLESIDSSRKVFVGRDPLTPPAWWSEGRYRIRFPDGVVREVRAPDLPVVPVPFAVTAPLPVPAAHTPWLPPPGPGQR
jgi:RsiW-degrading membrane proteinase PrsW (M82 family)